MLGRLLTLIALAALLLVGCNSEEEPTPSETIPQTDSTAPPAPVVGMPDLAAERGLDYVNVSGSPSKPTILDAGGAGVALLDLAEDGALDAVFTQGVNSLEAFVRGSGADLEVYQNDGVGRYERIPGPGLHGWWTGLASGDLDGDGRSDLVAGAFGDLVVLLQDRRGQLVASDAETSQLADWFDSRPGAHFDRSAAAGTKKLRRAPDWYTSLALFDADRDGSLDLYACRYLDLDPYAPPTNELGEAPLQIPCQWKGHPVYCGPRGMQAQADVLFSGNGEGAFRERTTDWLPITEPGFTLAVAPFDADMDGDTDLYVANDSVRNYLFLNEIDEERGMFVEGGMGAGVALNPDGLAEAGMGIAVGDVDGNGLFDLALTNFSEEPTHLYLAAAVGYDCATYRSGLAHPTRRLLSWGAHLVDFDGDGTLELFTANGHVYPQADEPGTGTSYAQEDSLFHLVESDGSIRARKVEFETPSVFEKRLGSRGSAVGDINGDGSLDLVINHLDAQAGLGWNGLNPDHNRLSIRCFGPLNHSSSQRRRTPADAMGTRLVLVYEAADGSGQKALLAEVQTARGYQSASSPWVHFGLGSIERFSSLTMLWPSGKIETIEGGQMNRRLTIREGSGVIEVRKLR